MDDIVEPSVERSVEPDAEQVVRACVAAGRTVATAESLTGGLVCAALTSVSGSSAVVRGGVVTYATDLKASLAGVDAGELARNGPVHADTARAMALGVRARLAADVGVATTGVAGPDLQDDKPVGLVYVAVAASEDDVTVRELRLSGDRQGIRTQTVQYALELVLEIVAPHA